MAFSGNYVCNSFKTALLNGDVDFAVDTIKLALYTEDATLNASTASYTTANEVSGGDYVAGGATLSPTVASSGSVSYVTFDNVTWNSALTARGALIYKEGGTAISVIDFGSDKVSTTSFVIQFPPGNSSSAILRLA
jgi:hypothetical protein